MNILLSILGVLFLGIFFIIINYIILVSTIGEGMPQFHIKIVDTLFLLIPIFYIIISSYHIYSIICQSSFSMYYYIIPLGITILSIAILFIS